MKTTAPAMVFGCAKVDIEAAAGDGEGKPTRVAILAYTGGVMPITGFGYTVVDLAGLEVPAKLPLLEDHVNKLGSVVGNGSAQKSAHELTVNGNLTSKTDAGKRAIELAADVPLQASVGVEIIASRRVGAGEAINVNGRKIVAPAGGLRLVTKGVLREVSLVPIGADDATAVSVACSKRQWPSRKAAPISATSSSWE